MDKRTFTPISTAPHNEKLEAYAEEKASWLRTQKSRTEEELIKLFKEKGINFKFKKIVYNRSSGGFIKQFFIIDFYIPSSNLVIETTYGQGGSSTGLRKYTICKNIPNVRFLYWRYDDFLKEDRLQLLNSYLENSK